MKDNKTTISAAILAVALYVIANPTMFAKWPWIAPAAGIIAAAGAALLGKFAKDSTTHSTVDQVQIATAEKTVADIKAVNEKLPVGVVVVENPVDPTKP